MNRNIISDIIIIAVILYFLTTLILYVIFGLFDADIFGIHIRIDTLKDPARISITAVFISILIAFNKHYINFRRTIQYVENNSRKILTALTIIITVTAIFLCYLKLKQYYLLQTTCYDHGLHANVSWNVLSGNGFYSSCQEINYLGGHFSPIYIFTSPLYYIWNNAGVLLILQSVGIVVGGVAIYFISLHITRDKIVSLLFVIFFFSNRYLHFVSRFDYHPVALFIPVCLFLIYSFEVRKWGMFIILTIIALLIKENIPLALAGFAIFMIFIKDSRKYGIILGIISIILFIVEIRVFMPMINDMLLIGRYSNFGENFNEVLHNIFLNPPLLLKNTILDVNKLKELLNLFKSYAFLPILSGIYIIPSIFPILWNHMSSFKGQWSFNFHYSSSIIPFLMYSSVYGYYKLFNILSRKFDKNKLRFLSYILILYISIMSFLSVPRYIYEDKNTEHISEFLSIYKSFRQTDQICAQTALMPHLALRKKIYMFGGKIPFRNDDYTPCYESDFIILDLHGNYYPYKNRREYISKVIELLKRNDFGVFHNSNGIIILKRDYSIDRNNVALQDVLKYSKEQLNK